MKCFDCGQGELGPSRVSLTGTRYGESFSIETNGLACSICGFKTVDSEQSAEFTQLVSDAYREKHGMLTGSEIRARRSHLGMSQQRFAEYLGAGVASIKRWESGQIQEKAMDELMRLKTDPGAARENLRSLEHQLPEQLVLFEGKDVTLVFTNGEHFQYGHPYCMKVEAFSIVDRDDLAIADEYVAA